MSSRRSSRSPAGIDKLDFDANRRRRPSSTDEGSGASSPQGLLRDDESLLSNVVEGIIERDKLKLKRQLTRYLSFASAIFSCLCGGSLTAFSVYGHLFLSRLQYSQSAVNAVSVAAELAMYLPVPVFGYLTDRYSPRPISLVAGFLFAFGYILAAFTYRAGPPVENGWPVAVMVVAFVSIGMGTSSIYLSAVTACVKNFGRGKHKGLALAIPIASFGLSGMWESQVGSRLLHETNPDGTRGDIDVFRFFLFLGIVLFSAGVIGSVALVVVDEEELIDEAVEELERSGLLEDSPFFRRSIIHDHSTNGYGTLDIDRTPSQEELEAAAAKRTHEEEEDRKKTWLLNGETRRFLADPTMWFLAAGFFLVTGPGETFINNLGTIIGTLYTPQALIPSANSAATHVSILAFTSTLARLTTGTLSDLLAPTSQPYQQYRPLSRDFESSQSSTFSFAEHRRFTVSRITFLLGSSVLLTIAFMLLASPLISDNPQAFPVVSALVGFANGAAFSLVPIIISVVWGVQNFGTNWGVIATMPALGAAFWSAIYSNVYQKHAGANGLCYGRQCFEATFWGMVIASIASLGLWAWAWKGRGGWTAKGIAV